MVKINDLRIGNYLNSPSGTINRIMSIGIRDLEIDRRSGIALTPDILRRCGFAKKGNSEQAFSNGKLIISFTNGSFVHGTASGNYLHQLQNLYYVMTAEELVYNH